MIRLSEHFTLSEFVTSQEAARRGIDNSPPVAVVSRLELLASTLELVRANLGHPLIISSGYRCPALNEAVGGSKQSAHMLGHAADFTCPGFGSPLDVAKAVSVMDLAFDQVIHEFGAWVHLSSGPTLRRQLLTIDHEGTRSGLFAIR